MVAETTTQTARTLHPSTEAAQAFGSLHAEVRHRIGELEARRDKLAAKVKSLTAEADRLKEAGAQADQVRPMRRKADGAAKAVRQLERELDRLAKYRRIWGFTDAHGNSWFFDRYAGERVIRWIETFCVHKKGQWRGQPLKLARWQRKIILQIFGWKTPDGFRRFSEAWIEIARKNGKSTLAAAIALYLMIGDREPAAEVYSVAGSRDQAALVYNDAYAMVELNPALNEQIDALKYVMSHPRSDSKFVAMGTKNQHGLNPSGAIGDEVHEWKKRDQYEAITTADGARNQPLFVFITTAGYDLETLCGELHLRAMQVARGLVYQPDLYVRIYSLDPGDDWKDEANWPKANPGLAYGAPKMSALQKAFRKAYGRPAEENSFKRLRLNQWTDSVSGWIRKETWDACLQPIDFGRLRGAKVWAGLDMALERDLSALVLLFTPENDLYPGKWIVGSKFWCAGEYARKRETGDNISYPKWIGQGLLVETPGNTVDFDFIEEDIIQTLKHFDVQALGYDKAFAHQMIQHIMKAGIPCVEVPQTITVLAQPTAEFSRKVHAQQLVHGGHEIMNWCIANTEVRHNVNGQYRPLKNAKAARNDGAVAAVNALAPVIHGEAVEESVYKSRGALVI
ncbi:MULTISPECIES: terminase TerL endonuclease subunit [Hyphomonas]|uniref:Terminase large subunit n=1 Tax=Hyphomonas adhaerens TaxID=81029 RepID=A0A3B9GWA0_9PROT|nr:MULTISPECIES: terminase TerL endonuclease subunit [Hyphomonas]MBB40967.1 hypothetical protein [Hyphomonas sp.]HAE26536.1 hypothetical protein [Hyphomonas adhaerens]